MTKSEIKLFLSVDIFGSTKLKNSHNYSSIKTKCSEEAEIANSFDPKKGNICPEDVFKQNCDSIYYQDWSIIIRNLFNDFNSCFCNFLLQEEIYPWKFCGDELIYCIPVQKRKDVYRYTLAFYKTLRVLDKKCTESNLIRLKGSAWTAGFPVRNRIIETPIPETFRKKDDSKDISEENFLIFEYPHLDYVGPEMDIGFRIGKYTNPGLIVVSLELAYILSDAETECVPGERFSIINVGWEVLKGVWDEKKYPILWLKMPNTYDSSKEFDYKLYNFWNKEENDMLKKYDRTIKHPTKYYKKKDIKKIIKELNESFGVIKPYFLDDGDKLPEEHKNLIDFMNCLDSLEKPDTNLAVEEIPNNSELIIQQEFKVEKKN